MKYIREHKKASVIIALAAIVLLTFLGLQRKNATSQSVFDTLKDAPRGKRLKRISTIPVSLRRENMRIMNF